MPDIRFDFFQVITIAAIINSLIFSVLLLRKKENRAANYFRSLLLFSIGLSISKLAQHTGLAEREISNALNQQLKKNFYAFVNESRVEEVKTRLADAQYAHLKILSIAFDAGFNSKATFNRVFKEYTGTSPKPYQAEHKTH